MLVGDAPICSVGNLGVFIETDWKGEGDGRIQDEKETRSYGLLFLFYCCYKKAVNKSFIWGEKKNKKKTFEYSQKLLEEPKLSLIGGNF